MQYWCEYAWLGGDTAAAGVLVAEADGVITDVTVGVPCLPGAVRLVGLTLPGLANAHSHAFHRALRGRTQVGSGTFWTWRDQMYELAATLTPDRYHRLARAVYGEMVRAGVTCVGEFHYVHHGPGGVAYADAQAMDEAIVAAADEAGVRLTLLDSCYLQGGIGAPLNEVQQRFADGDVDRWATRVDEVRRRFAGPQVTVGAAVHSVRAVPAAAMSVVGAWAERHGAPLHVHVSEQVAENEQCLAEYGRTPTGLLADHGLLGPRFTAVHATHISDQDVAALGRAGAAVCLCPTTERDLADGIGPAAVMGAAGVGLCLGSDSHAVIDLFEESRAMELDQRLATQRRGHHRAAALLGAASEGGHRSLGWGAAGRLAVGCTADLVSIRLDSVRTAGASEHSLLETAAFAATAADVHHVVVGGTVVVHDGTHQRLDVGRALADAIAEVWA